LIAMPLTYSTFAKSRHRAPHGSLILPARFFAQSAVISSSQFATGTAWSGVRQECPLSAKKRPCIIEHRAPTQNLYVLTMNRCFFEFVTSLHRQICRMSFYVGPKSNYCRPNLLLTWTRSFAKEIGWLTLISMTRRSPTRFSAL
jgi:hypothetical protein